MEHTVTSIQFNRTVKLQSRFSRGWFFSLVQKGVVSRSTVLPQSSRVHNGAQHRAWLIILGNDRFPIFIFKRIIPGKQEEEGTRKRCVRVVRQFFWTGSTGRVAAAFFFSCGKGLHSVAAGHSGKRGHFTGLCVSIHLPWTRLTKKIHFLASNVSRKNKHHSFDSSPFVFIIIRSTQDISRSEKYQSNFTIRKKKLIKKRVSIHLTEFDWISKFKIRSR